MMYVYICIRTYTHTHILASTYTYIYTYTQPDTHTHTHAHTRIRAACARTQGAPLGNAQMWIGVHAAACERARASACVRARAYAVALPAAPPWCAAATAAERGAVSRCPLHFASTRQLMSSRITRQHTGGIISARMQYNNQLPGGGKDVLKSLEQACAYLLFSVCVYTRTQKKNSAHTHTF